MSPVVVGWLASGLAFLVLVPLAAAVGVVLGRGLGWLLDRVLWWFS